MKTCKHGEQQSGQKSAQENNDFFKNRNIAFDTLEDESHSIKESKKYRDFIDYQPIDSINNTLVLLHLLREIYADKTKTSAENQVLNEFAKKCQFDSDELNYHENKIKEDMGVISYNHDIPIDLFWDIDRLCSIDNSSLFRVWVKNNSQSTFNKVSVNFVIDSDALQILSPVTEITLDIDQTYCYTSSYKVSADYPGGEIAFYIEVTLIDHHGQQWAYHSQDKLILKFSEKNKNRSAKSIEHTENTLPEIESNNKNENAALYKPINFNSVRNLDLREVNQGINNALKIPLMLINAVSESILKLEQRSDDHNAVYNMGLNISSRTGSLKKVEFVSYPFFTIGLAQNGVPELSDLGIEAKSGISRLHLSFCYADSNLQLQVLNSEGTVLNGVQIKDTSWQPISHGDNVGLFGDIELRVKISLHGNEDDPEQNDSHEQKSSLQICDHFAEKLSTITALMDDLKKKTEKRNRERILKLLNREYNEFLYMQRKLKTNDKTLNYIELYHTENSLIDNIKYFFLLDNITIGSDLMGDDLYISELAPSQVKLSFSQGKYYLTQLDAINQSAILRRSTIINLERYCPMQLEMNDIIQMGSDISLNLYEI